MKFKETWDLSTIPEPIFKSEWARRNSTKRKSIGREGGRPRSDEPRCACGEMTLKRAIARAHKCKA
jgi:hypothetical protein